MAGVKVPFKKEVKAGELLNFDQAAHVLHPVTWQIHKVTGIPVNTQTVVLDVAAGEKLELKKSSLVDYYFPGEALVLDANGNIELRNDLEDRGRYLAAVFGKDDKSEFGKRRRREKGNDPFGAGMGMGMGMGMGGPGGNEQGGGGGGKFGGGGGGKFGGGGGR